MKASIKLTLAGLAAICALLLVNSTIFTSTAKAADLTSGREQYKVVYYSNYISTTGGNVREDTAGFERELNKLGAEGWKVRTAMSTSIILAK